MMVYKNMPPKKVIRMLMMSEISSSLNLPVRRTETAQEII